MRGITKTILAFLLFILIAAAVSSFQRKGNQRYTNYKRFRFGSNINVCRVGKMESKKGLINMVIWIVLLAVVLIILFAVFVKPAMVNPITALR